MPRPMQEARPETPAVPVKGPVRGGGGQRHHALEARLPRLPGSTTPPSRHHLQATTADPPGRVRHPRGFPAAPLAFLLAGSLVAGLADPATAGGLELEAAAGFAATPDSGGAAGTFWLRTRTNKHRERASIRIEVTGLDLTEGEGGIAADHRVYLVAPEAGPRLELGALQRRADNEFRLRVRDASLDLPPSHPMLRHFEGGTLEIERLQPNPALVLTAVVPALHSPVAGDWVSSRRTWGRFEAIDIPRQSPGTFLLRTESHDGGEVRNRVAIVSSRLSPASYHVYLVNEPRTWTANIGPMTLLETYGATYNADSRRAAIPGGVTNLASFDGGRIEVRRGGTVVLRSGIPDLRGVAEPGIRQRIARASGTEELLPPEGGIGRGLLSARLRVAERSRRQNVRLRCVGLDPTRSTFRLEVIATDGLRYELGRFDARGDLGVGRLRLPRANTDGLPPGGLLALSRRTVEIRDRFGKVVLTGVFPKVE